MKIGIFEGDILEQKKQTVHLGKKKKKNHIKILKQN